MIVWVTAAKPLGGHRLWLEFNDGTSGEVDLESRLFGEVFEPLKDLGFFAQVQLDPELDYPASRFYELELPAGLRHALANEVAEP
jgi:hypothetical protein